MSLFLRTVFMTIGYIAAIWRRDPLSSVLINTTVFFVFALGTGWVIDRLFPAASHQRRGGDQ